MSHVSHAQDTHVCVHVTHKDRYVCAVTRTGHACVHVLHETCVRTPVLCTHTAVRTHGKGTPSAPDHCVDMQNEHGLWRAADLGLNPAHSSPASWIWGLRFRPSAPPPGQMENPALQAFLRLRNTPRTASRTGCSL